MSRSPDLDRLVILGRIARPHGVKGAFRIKSYARSAKSFFGLDEVWIRPEGGPIRPLPLTWAKPHSKGVLLKLEGLESPEDVRSLAGAEVVVPRTALPALEEDEYYWADLIGLEVLDQDGARLGRIKALFETKAHDVLVVDSEEGEMLIPAVESAVREVDFKRGILVVRGPENLDPSE